MTFWDTVLGHNLAETLIRNLPKIADSLKTLNQPAKRTQHAKIVNSESVDAYLNNEFESGRVFVSATVLNSVKTLVITE